MVITNKVTSDRGKNIKIITTQQYESGIEKHD